MQPLQERAGLFQIVHIQAVDPVLPLQERDIPVRPQQALAGMPPARQGLAARHGKILRVDKKLQIQLEFPLLQPARQIPEQIPLFFAAVAPVQPAYPGAHAFLARAYSALARMVQSAIAIAIARGERKHAHGYIALVQRRARAFVSADFA